jgi:hypothetical protein
MTRVIETIGSFDDDRASCPDAAFAEVLRAAIARRGLGLDRIKERLDRCGTPVSVATLSYWRSGRSQPERKRSLAALPHLESVLELPSGTLVATLTAPRERGRRRDVAELDSVWPEGPQTQVLGRLDTRWDTELERLSVHDVLTFGADRAEQSMLVREVVRARCDGPDRRVVLHCLDDPAAATPEILPRTGCRLGRTEADPRGTVGAELHFLQPLRRGQTAVLEYLILTRPPRPRETEYTRRIRVPTREYVVQVRFAPEAPPLRCESVRDDQPPWPLTLDAAATVHLVEVDCAPGERGIRWVWDASSDDPQVNC